jgi:hypothetical protein
MNELDRIVADIEEIHKKHRIPFEVKMNPDADKGAMVDRIEKQREDIQKDVIEKNLVNRIMQLPDAVFNNIQKKSAADLLSQGSINTAAAIMNIRLRSF